MVSSHWFLWWVGLSVSGWLYLILGRSGFWRAGPILDLVPPQQRQDVPDVVAVLPARNEAAYIGRSLRSLLAQDYGGRLTVIVVDDHSEDATRAIAEAVPIPPNRSLEVIVAPRLPPGWSGKLWALREGLRHAAVHLPGARHVLLTDADIAHDPGNLQRLVAKAEADRLDLVSLMVRLHCEHFWDRLLIPPFVFFFRKLYPFAAVNRPVTGHVRYRADSGRHGCRCPLSRGFGGFSLSSRHGGQVVWKAVPDPERRRTCERLASVKRHLCNREENVWPRRIDQRVRTRILGPSGATMGNVGFGA